MDTSIIRNHPLVTGVVESPFMDGKVVRVDFVNGYAASIARHADSYGGPAGLYEVAVLHGGELIYDTPITGDVLGYLHAEEVAETMAAIAALPPRD